jgi:hypothetical protein
MRLAQKLNGSQGQDRIPFDFEALVGAELEGDGEFPLVTVLALISRTRCSENRT